MDPATKEKCNNAARPHLPAISVIVVAHNTEAFLPRCLDSLLAQRFRDYEVILVDDGSSDRTPEILKDYSKRFSTCTVIHQDNQGVAVARNTGVKATRGTYVAFVDSDDAVTPTFLETHYQNILKSKCDISQAAYIMCSQPSKLQQPDESLRTLSAEEALIEMFQTEQYSVWSRLYARHLFASDSDIPEEVFPVGLTCEDRVANFTLISRAKCIVVTNRIEYYYFRNVGSISYSGLDRRGLDLLEADKMLVEMAYSYGNTHVLQRVEDRAAKGAYSLLVKHALFGVTDNDLDGVETVSRLREQFIKDYPRLMHSQLSTPKKIVAWQLRHAPALLKAEFTLYNAFSRRISKSDTL